MHTNLKAVSMFILTALYPLRLDDDPTPLTDERREDLLYDTVGTLSMVGIPIFAGFIPKLYFAAAAFHMGWRTWAVLLALALSTLLNVLYFLYTTLLLWVPEAGEKRDRRLKWAAVPGLVFAALNIAVGLRSYGLMDLFRQGMDLFCQ